MDLRNLQTLMAMEIGGQDKPAANIIGFKAHLSQKRGRMLINLPTDFYGTLFRTARSIEF